ncbi:MAG: hypothetical protein ABJM06_11325 [Gilvibacter sp.]
MKAFSKIKFLFLFVALLALCGGCNNNQSEDQVETAASNVSVAFAGGGWRAHSGHSAWTISLLQNGNRSLNDAFTNVKAVSSNSGGSWFSTMLMYSPKFISEIEAPNAITNWGISGWLGKQEKFFNDATLCYLDSGETYTPCVLIDYTHSLTWAEGIEKVVYKDYSLGSTTLSGAHQPWAKDKPLLLGATLLTNEVVLNQEGILDLLRKRYYQVCFAPHTPVLNGHHGSSCSNGKIADVTPVTFSSIPSSSGMKTAAFFSALQGGFSPQIKLGYTETKNDNPDIASASLANPIHTSQVPVMIAASASSAAAGYAASKSVTGSWEESYLADKFALTFSLASNRAQHTSAKDMSVTTLANNKVVRVADGGAADNSAVAQLVSYLQDNNLGNGFNIVAFDNVMDKPFTQSGYPVKIGTDLANLFGKGLCNGNQDCSGLNCTGVCVNVPNLKIFDDSALLNTPLTWVVDSSANGKDKIIIYTKYVVTTVGNGVFGVSAGSTGTLHAFSCIYTEADTAPQNVTRDGDFNAYKAMMQFIHSSLNANNGEGLKYLEAALGISN